MQNHYEILGVKKTISREDVIKRYKALAKEFHPDRVRRGMPDADESAINAQIEINTPIFQKISMAYTVLSDPEQRFHFDNTYFIEQHDAVIFEGAKFFSFNLDNLEEELKDLPFGVSINPYSLKSTLTRYHKELDNILTKGQTNSRYQKLSGIITELKKDLSNLTKKHFPNLDNDLALININTKLHVPGDDVYNFLIEMIESLKKARDTKEPESHRGLFWRTPVIRELLAPLIYALMRLIVFAILKTNQYLKGEVYPIFEKGLYHGLFKRPRTHTEYILDKMAVAVRQNAQDIMLSIQGTCPEGKTETHIFPQIPNIDDGYFMEEVLNFSPRFR